MVDRFSRQRPESVVPPPADDVTEGRSRWPRAESDRQGIVRLSLDLHGRAREPDVEGRRSADPAKVFAKWRRPDGGRLLGRTAMGEFSSGNQASPARTRIRGPAHDQ